MEGLSRANLADELGVTPDTIGRWERGVGSMKLSHLRSISVILDLDLNCLLGTNHCKE